MLYFTPEEAVRYAASNRLEDWLHAFLTTVGGNEPLSLGLKLQERFWLGPVLFPLALLTRCLGPEEEMEYCVSAAHWEAATSAMLTSMEQGWEPPPLIAMYVDGGVLSVRDGNHRQGALVKHGRVEYWTIVWCNRLQDYAACCELYPQLLNPSSPWS